MPIPPTTKALPLPVALRRVTALSAVAGFVEVIGYSDCGGIYPAIMTGNTVQLGLTFAKTQWTRFELIGFAVSAFFVGCIIASLIRRRLRHPMFELVIMAGVLVVAGLVRLQSGLRIPLELPLLALALAMQGEAIAQFGGVSVQTLVVTNSMVKFSDALVGLVSLRGKRTAPDFRDHLAQMALPGMAWLTYSVAAGLGALAMLWLRYPLVAPAAILTLVVFDLTRGESPSSADLKVSSP